VIFVEHLARIDGAGRVAADRAAVVKGDALGLHLRDAAVDDVLLHLEIGNAIAKQAAGLGPALEQMHVMADTRELLREGQPRRARADHRALLAGLSGRYFRLDPT